MKKNLLLHTNLMVCMVIIIGFVVTSLISYHSNQEIIRKDVESVSKLTSEGITHQIDSFFTKPIHISLTMANDNLLKTLLEEEEAHLENPMYIDTVQNYLDEYQKKYEYDSLFLASAQTRRYYCFYGLDRILEYDDAENEWFYDFLEHEEEYSINIDNDQVKNADNEITVFINCRIKGTDGQTLGVVGIGFRVNTLQSLLKSYESQFGVRACLIDKAGNIEISTDRTNYEGKSSFFDDSAYAKLQTSILNNQTSQQSEWYTSSQQSGYIVSRYIENLNWYLIIDHDTTVLNHQLHIQLLREILIVIGVIGLVLLTITSVIHGYNRRIIELIKTQEQAHQMVFQRATEQMYEDIYEINVTKNCAASEVTIQYFESLGILGGINYNDALKAIAEKQIKEEYRQGYINTFNSQNILKVYESGQNSLKYDLMITTNGETYYWIRMNAHIFYWNDDSSVRMLIYRQNIDIEKQRELYLYEQMQKDSLTGLYNKLSTQEHVRKLLAETLEGHYAFFVIDIDTFKGINDCLGHAIGDAALTEFAHTLKQQFHENDIVGRIGGDEFAAFLPLTGAETAEEKAIALLKALRRTIETESGTWHVTASIGIALTPESGKTFEELYKKADCALYQAKKQGRDRFVIAK